MVAALVAKRLFLLLLSIFDDMLLVDVAVHAVYVADAEARGEDGDLDLLAQLGIDGDTPLDLEAVVKLGHEVVHVVHLLHHEAVVAVLAVGEVDAKQNFLRVEDVAVVEQGRVERIFDGPLHTSLSLAVACAHDGHATVFEHGLHVVEVEVYESVVGDDLSNALCCHAQGVVGLAEGIEHGELGVDGTQTLVVDDEQGVDMLRHLLHAVERLVDLAVALEAERYGHDAHGEDAKLLGDACYDGRCTCACAASHASCDERHLGAVV